MAHREALPHPFRLGCASGSKPGTLACRARCYSQLDVAGGCAPGGAPAVVGNISADPPQGVQRRRDRRSCYHRLTPVGRIPGGRFRGLDAFRWRSPGSLRLAARALFPLGAG